MLNAKLVRVNTILEVFKKYNFKGKITILDDFTKDELKENAKLWLAFKIDAFPRSVIDSLNVKNELKRIFNLDEITMTNTMFLDSEKMVKRHALLVYEISQGDTYYIQDPAESGDDKMISQNEKIAGIALVELLKRDFRGTVYFLWGTPTKDALTVAFRYGSLPNGSIDITFLKNELNRLIYTLDVHLVNTMFLDSPLLIAENKPLVDQIKLGTSYTI